MNSRPYEARYVAFMDVLGFSAMVENSTTADSRQAIYQIIFDLNYGVGHGGSADDSRLTQFSDCVVLSVRPSRKAIFWLLSATQYFSASFLERGVLVRGGIAFGPLIHDDIALFGPALLTAYRMDASGGPPRILLDDSIVPEIPLEDDYYLPDEFIRTDHEDGRTILHSFNAYARASRDLDKWPAWRRHDYEKIALLIRDRCGDPTLSANAQRKWHWIKRYWNAEVAMSRGISSV